MFYRLLHSSMLYTVRLKQQLRRISISWLLILLVQTFSILIFSIQANIHPNTNLTLQHIYDGLNQQISIQLFSMFGFLLSLLLLVSFIIYIVFKKPISELDHRTLALNRLISVSAVMVNCFEAIVIIIIWHYKLILPNLMTQSKNVISHVLVFAVNLVGIAFVGVINHRIRVMGQFSFLFLLLTNSTFNISIASACIGIVICCYVIKTDEDHDFLLIKSHNLRKMVHLFILAFLFWKVLDHFNFSQARIQNPYATFIYLATMMWLSLIIGFLKFVCKVNRKQAHIIQLCQCFQNLQKDPDDTQSLMIAKQIASECFKRVSKRDQQQNLEFYQLSKKCQKEWKTEDWLLLVDIMIKQQYAKQATIESGINMIKCRLMVKDQRLFETIKLFKELIHKNKHKNVSTKYELLKITLKIEQAYFKKHQTTDHPIVHIIREVDNLSEQFYKMCCQQIQLIYEFWATVLSYKSRLEADPDQTTEQKQDQTDHTQVANQKSIQALQNLILKINQRIQSLKRIHNQIQLISSAKREEKALDYIKFLATYTYQQHQDFIDKVDSQKDYGQDQQHPLLTSATDYSQYLQIMDSKVTKLSLKLASDLHYRKIQVIGENINALIPQVYQDDIEKTIVQHNQPILKVPYLVPIISNDGSILLKSVTSYVELDSEHGFRISYHFTNPHINKTPILLYNYSKNMIQFYNNAFVKCYKISKIKMDAKIRNKLFNPDQIFKDLQLSDKNIQAKLSQSGFQAEYNCRMQTHFLSEKKHGKYENVRLSLIQKQKGYMILRVMKGHRMKSLMGQQTSPSTKTQSFSSFSIIKNYNANPREDQMQNQYKQNEDQILACKIQNPYESKINLKKSQLNKSNKHTLKFYTVFFIFLSILLLIIEGLTFVQINDKITNYLKEQSNQKLSTIHQYTSLMLAYQSHYKYALLKMHKTQIQNLGIDFNRLLEKSGKDIQDEISLFQNEYLINFKQQQLEKIPYDVKFKYFTIQTDTSTTNLFDFSQNLLLYDNQDSLEFLMKNFQTFRFLSTKTLPNQQTIYLKLSSRVIINYIFSAVVMSFALICIGLSMLFALKIEFIRSHIQQIFILMNKNNLEYVFKALKSIKKRFFQIGDHTSAQGKRFQKIGENCLQIQKSYKSQKQYPPIQINQKQFIIEETERAYDSQKLIQNQSFKLLQKQNKYKCLKLTKSKYVGLYRYGLIIGGLVLVNILQILYLKDKVDLEYRILQFKINNQLITQNLIHQILEAEHYLITSIKQNKTEQYTASSEMALINSKKLPSQYFEQYNSEYFSKISGNLCDTLKYKSSLSYSYEQCRKMGNGILSFGLPKTIQHLNQLLIQSTKEGIDFWFSKSQNRNYSIFQEIFYSQQIVISINNENERQLNQQIGKVQQAMGIKAIQIFTFSCLLSCLLLAVMCSMKKFIYRSSMIGVGYFLIMPKKVLLQHQVLAHIRQTQLLQRIDLI